MQTKSKRVSIYSQPIKAEKNFAQRLRTMGGPAAEARKLDFNMICDDVDALFLQQCKICLGLGHNHKHCATYKRLIAMGKAKPIW